MGIRPDILSQLGSKPFVSKMLSVNYLLESITEDIVVVTVGKTPFQFPQVPLQVLAANLVEGSDNGTLEQGSYAFNSLRVS